MTSILETSRSPASGTQSGARRPIWGRRGTASATIAAALSFEDVHHRFESVDALRGITLDIAPAEVLCLLGESGCGKTTLLRIAAGVELQTSGSVLINGREVASKNTFLPPEKRGIGLMFQDYALFPHMTILQNVMFGLADHSAQSAEYEAVKALKRVGLQSYAGSYPHALSGGEQQRVALSRAIAPRPGIFLMDEPFSGLDSRLRDNIREETLAVLREIRSTCVIVTHDPEEAMRMGDRIALMRAGRVVQLGTSDELYRHPGSLFAARFFSELNEFPAEIINGVAETPFGRVPCPDVTGTRDGTATVRLQDVRIGLSEGDRNGRVVRRQFLGEVDLLEIAVEGVDITIRARCSEIAQYPTGTNVKIGFDPEVVMIFPEDAG